LTAAEMDKACAVLDEVLGMAEAGVSS
jgi:hypothetical protein